MRHTSDHIAIDLIALAILCHEDNIVLVQQQLDDGVPPTWVIPGGLVEAGELVTEALIREVQEEAGAQVEAIEHMACVMQIDRPAQHAQTLAYFFEVARAMLHSVFSSAGSSNMSEEGRVPAPAGRSR